MVGRGQKRKQPSADNELSQEVIPALSDATSTSNSSVSGSNSLDRLAEIMANFIQNQNTVQISAPKMGTAKGDVVPEFNPEDREQSSERWLIKVDELRHIFHWSEEATMYFALSKLKGLAEIWYKGLQTMKFTWEEWKQKILLAFPSVRDHHEKLSDMMRRRKRHDESYSRYYYEKLTLINQCKITGVDAVSCLLGGIDDMVIKASAKAGNYQTPEDFFKYLSSLHDLRPSTSKPTMNKQQHFNNHRKMEITNRKENRNQEALKCFQCGKDGHMRRECNNVKRCTYCRGIGHLENDCFIKQKRRQMALK